MTDDTNDPFLGGFSCNARSSFALDLRFIGQNTRGLNDSIKRKTIFDYVNKKADVIFLQETHSCQLTEEAWDRQWDGSCEFSHGTSAARGCMTLISKNVEHKMIDSKADTEGRFLLSKCEIQGMKFFLINIYAPNSEKEHAEFLKNLYDAATEFYEDEYYHIIKEGDWNFTF